MIISKMKKLINLLEIIKEKKYDIIIEDAI